MATILIAKLIRPSAPNLTKLKAPDFRQLKQRITVRCNLQPFQPQETIEYINSRLARAGMKEKTVFSPELLAEIHRRTQGIPRLINLAKSLSINEEARLAC